MAVWSPPWPRPWHTVGAQCRSQCRSVNLVNARRKPRTLTDPWSQGRGLQAEASAEPAWAAAAATRWLRPGFEVRTAAVAPHLRVVAAEPGRPCQGHPAVQPSLLAVHPPQGGGASDPRGRDGPRDRAAAHPGAEPHPGLRSRDQAGESSGSGSGSRGLAVQPGLAEAGWPLPALDPFPWQRSELRRPTAAKPRCVTSRRHPG